MVIYVVALVSYYILYEGYEGKSLPDNLSSGTSSPAEENNKKTSISKKDSKDKALGKLLSYLGSSKTEKINNTEVLTSSRGESKEISLVTVSQNSEDAEFKNKIEEVSIKECPFCNKKLNITAKFCNNCGEKLVKEDSQ